MFEKGDREFFGRAVFFIGVVVSVISAFMGSYASSHVVVTLLTILGFLVGFFSISREDYVDFLVAVAVMVVFGIAGIEVNSAFGETPSKYFGLMFRNYTVFVASAGFIVAKRVIFSSGEGIRKKRR